MALRWKLVWRLHLQNHHSRLQCLLQHQLQHQLLFLLCCQQRDTGCISTHLTEHQKICQDPVKTRNTHSFICFGIKIAINVCFNLYYLFYLHVLRIWESELTVCPRKAVSCVRDRGVKNGNVRTGPALNIQIGTSGDCWDLLRLSQDCCHYFSCFSPTSVNYKLSSLKILLLKVLK